MRHTKMSDDGPHAIPLIENNGDTCRGASVPAPPFQRIPSYLMSDTRQAPREDVRIDNRNTGIHPKTAFFITRFNLQVGTVSLTCQYITQDLLARSNSVSFIRLITTPAMVVYWLEKQMAAAVMDVRKMFLFLLEDKAWSKEGDGIE